MFIGRKDEKKRLEEIYNSERNNLLVLYGRLGIGKTALINEFIQGKNAVYYLGRECTEREQKQRIFDEFAAIKQDEEVAWTVSYHDIFARLMNVASPDKDKKQLLILDEFHYIAQDSSDFIEAMLKLTAQTESRWMIVLISSSINWVEHSMVSVLGSVARKITGFMKLKPLSFAEVVEWFPRSSVEDCIMINAVIGGIPRYLSCWQENKKCRDNIIQLIMSQNGRFFDEAEYVLKSELRELAAYNSILYAMAEGKNKLNDIYHHTGFSRAKISVYIKNLIQMDLVEKVFSFDTRNKNEVQKGLYRIKDNFIHFWYRYVFPNKSKLELGQGRQVYDSYLMTDIDSYMRSYFAEVCSEYLKLMSQYNRLEYKYDNSGSWYGKKGKLDIIMQDNDRNSLAAICIWEDKPCEAGWLEHIKELCEAAALKTKEIYLFSKAGFAEDLKRQAVQEKSVHLVPMSSL